MPPPSQQKIGNPSAYRRKHEPRDGTSRKWPHIVLALGCAIALTLLVTSYFQSSLGLKALAALRDQSARLDSLDRLQMLLVDAETGMRGFLLTGDRVYLAPYQDAIGQFDTAVGGVREAFPEMANEEVAKLVSATHEKLASMATAVARAGAGNAVSEEMLGKAQMDTVRTQIAALRHRVVNNGHDIIDRSTGRFRLSQYVGIALAAVTLQLLLALFAILQRQFALRERISRLLASENDRLDEQVRQRTQELRDLARYITNAREAEQARLARELHDEMGALLTAAKMDASWIARKLPDEARAPFQSRFDRLQKLLTEGITLKRRIIDNLRPPLLAELGLIEALRALGEDLAQQQGIRVEIELPDTLEIDGERGLALFRIAQEAVTNIRKYAKANHVHLSLKVDAMGARLTVDDNGVGFEPAQASATRHGLKGMKHRVQTYAGEFTLRSSPGRGTTVSVRIPIA